jgi:hypothetical protein
VVEHLPSKPKVLSSNPSNARERERETVRQNLGVVLLGSAGWSSILEPEVQIQPLYLLPV